MMTSQDIYRKYQQSVQEAHKCLHPKEMGHPFESNAGKVHPISVSKEQLKKTLSSGYFPKASKYAVVQADEHKKGSKRKGSFSFSKTCEMINQISNCTHCQTASNALSHSTDNGLRQVLESARPHGPHLNGVKVQSPLCRADFGKCLDEFQDKLKEDNCLCAVAKEESKHKSHEKFDESSLEKHSENNVPIYSNTTNTNTIEAFALNPNYFKPFKKIGSKCLESLTKDQSCSTSIDPHLNRRLQTTILPSARRIVNTHSSQISTEPELQKCRSLVSVGHCPLKHSVDVITPHATQELMSPLFNNNDTQFKSSCPGWSRERQIPQATVGENMDRSIPRSQYSSNNQSKKKTSSNIQRIQQQLLCHQTENGDRKGSIFKSRETTAPEKNQDHETNGSETVRKKDFTFSERLHKEEKPYRQWHRMSRVVTAESKFIISPMLPNHLGLHWCTNQNKFLPSQIEESPELEMDRLVQDKTTKSLASEGISELDIKTTTCKMNASGRYFSTSIPGLDMSTTGQPGENKEIETLGVEMDTPVNILSMSGKVTETEDIEITQTKDRSKLSLSDPILGTISVHSLEADSKTNSNGCFVNPNENVVGIGTFENPETSSESRSNKCPTLSLETSLARYKSFTIKPVHKTRLNELSKAILPVDQGNGCDFKSKHTVDILRSLNAVSGVSQVMGPSFTEEKKMFSFEPSSKKKSKCGPKLRTAERSHNRGKASAMLAGEFAIFPGTDMHATFFKEPQDASRNMSRNSSKNFSRDSSILNAEIEHPKVNRCQPPMRSHPKAGIITAAAHSNDCSEYSNRNWSSDIGVTGEITKDALETTAKMSTQHKVFLADVASKLFHRVGRAGLRVKWGEPRQKYTSVKKTWQQLQNLIRSK